MTQSENKNAKIFIVIWLAIVGILASILIYYSQQNIEDLVVNTGNRTNIREALWNKGLISSYKPVNEEEIIFNFEIKKENNLWTEMFSSKLNKTNGIAIGVILSLSVLLYIVSQLKDG